MKIPSDVRINGIDYPVVYEARLNDGAHLSSGIYQVLQDNGRKLFDLTTSEVHT